MAIASGVNVSGNLTHLLPVMELFLLLKLWCKWRRLVGNSDAITIAVIPPGYELSTDAMGGAYSSDRRLLHFQPTIFEMG